MKDFYKNIRKKYEDDPQEYWNEVASKYKSEDAVLVPGDIKIKNQYYDSVQRKVLLKVFKQLNVGSKILDVGCGVGRWSFALAKRGMKVIGVDISKEMVKIAKDRAEKQKLENVGFLVSKAHEIDFPPESFDAVLAITVLQHILDDKQRNTAVEKMVRDTKKGGKLLILEKVVPENFKEFHVKPLTENDWIKLFGEHGAKFLESYPVPNSPLVELVTSVGTKLKYRQKSEVNEYPGSKSIEEIASKPIRAAYTVATSAAIAVSKPIDFVLGNKMFSRFSKHKLMVFEKI